MKLLILMMLYNLEQYHEAENLLLAEGDGFAEINRFSELIEKNKFVFNLKT